MQVTFAGANREVTGSCYAVEAAGKRIVVDCGMFQGGKYAEDKNSAPFPFDPASVDVVVVTHAHFDHIGRLPKLVKDGFRGQIYATQPTCELAMIVLRDALHLMEDEAERHFHQPLYGEEEVEGLSRLWQPLPYETTREVQPGVQVTLTDAGHILGSASVTIQADNQTIVFSGDLGNPPVPLLNGTAYVRAADVVIMESTYGNRVHEPGVHRTEVLRDAILSTVKQRGVLLIPSFALERTQELLFELNHLHDSQQIPSLPIYLDSPLAIAATEIFRKYPDFFNTEARAEVAQGDDLFAFPGLQFSERSNDSKAILHVPGPKVIIAGSGMMNGGRILHHLKNYLDSPSTTVLIIGYQVEGSLGRRLHHGERHVQIFGQEIDVRARVVSCGAFSGHADYPHLIRWLSRCENPPPRKVFITHGELNSALAFSQAIEDYFGIASAVPEYGESVDIANLGANGRG